MRFTKFEIKNYKGIQDLTLDLDKKPISKIITLVGLNESGKTSILQAINLLQNGLPESERHKLIPKKHKLSFSGDVEVKGYLSLTEHDTQLLFKFAESIGFASIKTIKSFSLTRTYRFINSNFKEEFNYWYINIEARKKDSKQFILLNSNDKEWQEIVTYLRDKLIPKILFYPDFLFNFPNKIYLDKETSLSHKQDKFRDVVQDILSSIDKNLSIEEHLISRLKKKTEGSQEALEHTLSAMSSQISKVVLGAWKNIMNIQGKEIIIDAKSEMLPNYKAIFGSKENTEPKENEAFYLEFRLKEGNERYSISERSLGFKWFFTFLLFTEFRKNRKTDIGEPLFLLDEPASNLHSTAQKKLLAKFNDLVSNSSLLYTTHSHHLINPAWLNGTYIVRNEAANYIEGFDFDTTETNIKAIPYKQFVASNPEQKDYFQPILDALEYQPGLLEKIPRIIITEGKSDYYILRYVNEVIMKSKYLNLNLYPGNGADGNDQVIRLYRAWNREFKILLDGNGGGEKGKKRYIKVHGEEINSQIITFLDIDPTYNYAVENLFNDNEKLLITQKFDTSIKSYDKSKFSSAIQGLLVAKEIIKLSEETLNKFDKIYTKILISAEKDVQVFN